MLKICYNQDLFNNEDKLHVIAHSCNVFGHMGAGVAKIIAKKYPEAYERDKLTPCGERDKLGSFSYIFDEKDQIFVANLYTQFTHWDPKDMFYSWALYDSLVKFIFFIEGKFKKKETIKVGVPGISCGLARGNPFVVYNILKQVDNYFCSRGILLDIYVYLIDEKLIKIFEMLDRSYMTWQNFAEQNIEQICGKKESTVMHQLTTDLINEVIEEKKNES